MGGVVMSSQAKLYTETLERDWLIEPRTAREQAARGCYFEYELGCKSLVPLCTELSFENRNSQRARPNNLAILVN